MTVNKSEQIWLSTDPDSLQSIESGMTSWHRDTLSSRPAAAREKPYPEYKRPQSVNGYYVASNDKMGREWTRLRDAHFRYLDLAIEHGRAPDWRSVHEPELLESLVEVVGGSDTYQFDLREILRNREKRRRRLELAPKAPAHVEKNVRVFQRNPDVVAEVLERARGSCELCGKPAPFRRLSDGTAYLEVHHCIRLADDGDDTVENAIALCPTCHRWLHYGLSSEEATQRAQEALRQPR